MIDIRLLRDNPDAFKKTLGRKRFDPANVDAVIKLDADKRVIQTQVEEMRAKKNAASKGIGKAAPDQRAAIIAESKKLGDDLVALEKQLEEQEAALKALLIQIPNPPHESVPDGAKDEEGATVKVHGTKPDFGFEARDHVTLAELHGTLDTTRAANLSGSRFAYLLGELVHVQFALIQFAVNKLAKRGFTAVIPPIMVREKGMYGTGFFPADANEIYKLEGEDLYMVGTSEVSLAGLHMDEVLPAEQLPLRYVGYSTCLRKEAGTYGKDTRGIFRVHQFDKVEMFSFCHPDKSWEEHELIRTVEEEIATELGFHFRVMNIAAGDLGAPAAKKYDLEVWLPGQNAYRELTSCSNCTDYQARRLNCRFKGPNGVQPVHTLNGTATAIGRTLIALMETHQQADGSVKLPEVLHRWLPDGMTEIAPKKKAS